MSIKPNNFKGIRTLESGSCEMCISTSIFVEQNQHVYDRTFRRKAILFTQ